MIPIVFIHSFNHDYLPISLWKARETNPNSEIFLIGDSWNAHFGGFVTHVLKEKYSKEADLFAKNFVNFSTNPSDFELVCLQRWMVLEQFLREKNFEKCLYLDSDVLLFDSISSDAFRFSNYGMTIAGISGHTNFIQNRMVLSEFCDWIKLSYSTSSKIKGTKEKYLEFRKYNEAGGISDMTYFTEFREKFPEKILDIGNPIEGKMFDITITYTKGLQSNSGLKELDWRSGKPFAKTLNGEEIEMRSIHFQGNSKHLMLEMAKIKSPAFKGLFFFNKALVLFQKAFRKLFK